MAANQKGKSKMENIIKGLLGTPGGFSTGGIPLPTFVSSEISEGAGGLFDGLDFSLAPDILAGLMQDQDKFDLRPPTPTGGSLARGGVIPRITLPETNPVSIRNR